MKFVITQALCKEGFALIEGQADVFVADNGDPAAYISEMQNADAFIIRIGKIDRKTIEQSPKLKVIGLTAVGFDTVDTVAATEAGIPVTITPGANSRSVAEHSIAMMLAISKDLVESHIETQKGNFSSARSRGKCYEVFGKKVGLIGLGAIGAQTARLCRALGMETLAYDQLLTKENIEALGCIYYENYEEMLKECDFLSLHVPFLETTRNMITKKHLETMKRTAIIINCARGGIINEADLVDALENEIIAAAGIDVFMTEPPALDDPLLKAKNVLISPHSAALSREAVIAMHTMCVEGCLAVLNGEKYPHVANPDVYKHPKWNN